MKLPSLIFEIFKMDVNAWMLKKDPTNSGHLIFTDFEERHINQFSLFWSFWEQ